MHNVSECIPSIYIVRFTAFFWIDMLICTLPLDSAYRWLTKNLIKWEYPSLLSNFKRFAIKIQLRASKPRSIVILCLEMDVCTWNRFPTSSDFSFVHTYNNVHYVYTKNIIPWKCNVKHSKKLKFVLLTKR